MSGIRAKLGWLRRRPKQLTNDYKNSKRIKNANRSPNRIYYFGVPEHSNLGDLAQCFCIKDLNRKKGITVIMITQYRSFYKKLSG